MAVLNTTSPTERPGAPTDSPSNTVPSSSARIAGWVTGFAYVGLQKTAGAVRNRPGASGIRRAGLIPDLPPIRQTVMAPTAPGHAVSRMQRAAGEDVAVAGAVRQFQPLAGAGELHQVLADDVAGAQRGVSRLRAALPGRRAQREGGPGRRIRLARVVRFDDVAVPAGQRAC